MIFKNFIDTDFSYNLEYTKDSGRVVVLIVTASGAQEMTRWVNTKGINHRRCSSEVIHLFFMKQSLSLARLPGQWAPGICLSLPPQFWDYKRALLNPDFSRWILESKLMSKSKSFIDSAVFQSLIFYSLIPSYNWHTLNYVNMHTIRPSSFLKYWDRFSLCSSWLTWNSLCSSGWF